MSHFITLLLAALAPTIAVSAANTTLFSKKQIRNSIIMAGVFAVAIASMNHFAVAHFLHPQLKAWTPFHNEILDVFVCVISLSVFFFLSQKSFSQLVPEKKTRRLVTVATFAFFVASSWWLSVYALMGLLALFSALSIYDLIRNMDFSVIRMEDPIFDNSIKFKHKPNVYVLFLESMHSKEALKEIYDIDGSALFTEMEDMGFTNYENVCSNRTATRISFLSMVWPQLMYHGPLDVYEGNKYAPNAFSVFERNGYQVNIFSSEHLRCYYSMLFHNLGNTYAGIGQKAEKHFSPILSQNSMFRDALSTPDLFGDEEDQEGRFEAFEHQIKTAKGPQVQVIHFGAQHVVNQELELFKRDYRKAYQTAAEELKKTLSMIKENDPSPLIIAVGDHGAQALNRAQDSDADMDKSQRAYAPRLYSMDLCSVMLGIHWPIKNYIQDDEVISHARIFNHVFAALCEDDRLLENMMPNLSLEGTNEGMVVIARDGVLLDDWELLLAKDLNYFEDKVAKDPQNIIHHINLVNELWRLGKKGAAIEYVTKQCSAFPRSSEMHARKARLHYLNGDLDEAEECARTAYGLDPKNRENLFNFKYIALRKNDIEGCYRALQELHDIVGFFERGSEYLTCSDNLVSYLKTHTLEETFDLFRSISPALQGYACKGLDKRYLHSVSQKVVDGTDWLIATFEGADDVNIKRLAKIFLMKGYIFCLENDHFEKSLQIAGAFIDNKEHSVGLTVRHAVSLEKAGRINEALGVYVKAIQEEQLQILALHLGLFLVRNDITIAELENLKANSQRFLAGSLELIPSIEFDVKWYAREYADILSGLHPLQHYVHYSVGLNLKPHSSFDTAKYLASNSDIFESGIDPALHYYQFGKKEGRLFPATN